MSPLRKPVVNHCWRCAAEPCVQDSGVTRPWNLSWIRSSPTAAAASSPSRMSAGVSEVISGRPVDSSGVVVAWCAQTPA